MDRAALDPNVLIQESKVGTCDLRPGRRPTGAALRELVTDYARRAGIVDDVHPRVVTASADAQARSLAAAETSDDDQEGQ